MERDGRATTGSLVQGAAASNDVEPAPPGAWSWLERHGLWLIVLVCTGWRAWLAWPYQAALVMRDEAGYLGNAAALAGYVFDGASSYHAGYSLLIVPAYLLFSDPAQIYRCVQVINLLLGIASTCLLYNLVASLFPGERRERILLAVLVGSLYPAWFVLSSLAMSENASIPTFLLALWSCLQVARRGGGWWIAWALSTGFLFTIHPTGIASIGAGVLVAAALAAARGEWKWLLAFIAAIAVVVLATTSLLQPWLVHRLTLGSFPPNLHYPSLGAMLEPMRSMAGIVGLANHFAGHVLYLLVGTLWLVWFAAQHAAHGLHRSVTQRALPGDVAVLAFAMLALLGTLGMSVVMFTAFRTVQLDHLMYGRYVEVSLLPLLACGFIVATRRGSFTSFIVGALAAGLLAWCFAAASGYSESANNLNISALWQPLVMPGRSPLWWWLGAAAIGAVVYACPGVAVRATLACGVFVVAVVLVYERYLDLCYEIYATRDRIAAFVRSHHDARTTCVGVDPTGRTGTVALDLPFARLGTQLYDHGLRRVSLDEWSGHCNGPLISWQRDLDRRIEGLHLAAVEKHEALAPGAGPYLWTREPTALRTLGIGATVPATAASAEFPYIMGSGWHAPEAGGTWSSSSGDLWVTLDAACASQRECGVILLFTPFAASATRPMKLDVFVEGEPVASWKIESATLQERFIRLDRAEAFPSGVHVKLVIEGATSPKELDMSADPRVLGISLHALRIAAIPEKGT